MCVAVDSYRGVQIQLDNDDCYVCPETNLVGIQEHRGIVTGATVVACPRSLTSWPGRFSGYIVSSKVVASTMVAQRIVWPILARESSQIFDHDSRR